MGFIGNMFKKPEPEYPLLVKNLPIVKGVMCIQSQVFWYDPDTNKIRVSDFAVSSSDIWEVDFSENLTCYCVNFKDDTSHSDSFVWLNYNPQSGALLDAFVCQKFMTSFSPIGGIGDYEIQVENVPYISDISDEGTFLENLPNLRKKKIDNSGKEVYIEYMIYRRKDELDNAPLIYFEKTMTDYNLYKMLMMDMSDIKFF
jgi:hypothetical protein